MVDYSVFQKIMLTAHPEVGMIPVNHDTLQLMEAFLEQYYAYIHEGLLQNVDFDRSKEYYRELCQLVSEKENCLLGLLRNCISTPPGIQMSDSEHQLIQMTLKMQAILTRYGIEINR